MSGFYSFLIYLLNEKLNPGLRQFGKSSRLPISSYPWPNNGCTPEVLSSGLNFIWRAYLMPTALIFLKYLVIIYGGDAESFESLVKDHIFVVLNLVLLGLN